MATYILNLAKLQVRGDPPDFRIALSNDMAEGLSTITGCDAGGRATTPCALFCRAFANFRPLILDKVSCFLCALV